MATVIDELIVTLGLDPKNFTDGQREALKQFKRTQGEAESTRKRMESEGSRAAEGFFGKMKTEALGLFAILAGANSLKQFVATQVEMTAATDRMAKAAGSNITEFTMFGNVIAANGGKAESAMASLARLSQVMEDWRTFRPPSADMLMAFSRIGAQASDTPVTVFEKFAKWAEGKDPRLVAQTGNILGFDEAATNEAMKGLTAVMNDFADAKMRGLPNEEDAKKLRALQTAFRGLQQQITAAGRALLVDFAPALTQVMDEIAEDMGGDPTGRNPGGGNLLGALGALFSGIGHLITGKGPLKDRLQPGDLGYRGGGAAGPYDAPGPGGNYVPGVGYIPGVPAGAGAAAAGGAPGGAGAKLAASLRAAGFTPAQAAGIAAWSYAESGYRTGAFNSTRGGHGAYGIGQWRGDRQTALFAKYGRNPTLDQQIAFLVSELGGSESGAASAIKGTRTAQAALWATITRFGRGSDTDNLGDYRRGSRFLAAGAGAAVAGGGNTTLTIGQINVNAPQAKDAHGVARGIRGALTGQLAPQANRGLTG